MEEENLGSIIKQTILDGANAAYPKTMVKDIDGDRYDVNERCREAFVEGILFGIKLKNSILKSTKND